MTWAIVCLRRTHRSMSCELGKNPFCKGEKPHFLAGEGLRLPFEGKKIPTHMTWPIVFLPSNLL
jgi:hypothetical protein